MQQRLIWYKLGFIINTVSIYLLTGFILYQVFILKPLVNNDDVTGLLIICVLLAIYSSNNFWGLNLVKRSRLHENISRTRIGWVITGLIFLLVTEIILSIALYSSIRSYLTYYRITGFNMVNRYTYSVYVFFLLIVLTGFYNFIATILLVKKVRSNRQEFEELIQGIGSGS